MAPPVIDSCSSPLVRSGELRAIRVGGRGQWRVEHAELEVYRGRNVIERDYSDVKQWRGLATRYDKLALTYRAGTILRAITQWLNHLI